MTQSIFINYGKITVQVDFPDEDSEVIDGIPWGNVAGFPTLAYWAYRVFERRIGQKPVQYKLGKNLLEEIVACLLGGHGIPASMGLAAFEHLREKQAFTGEVFSETQLHTWLSEPILHNGKMSKYRFSKQKAAYIHSALNKLDSELAPLSSGKILRAWLMSIKGIGPKTASWVARNWLDADDVAILDIHIYRAGILAKIFTADMTVEKHYFELEEKFLRIAKALNVSAAELDAVMWHEMQSSTRIHHLLTEMQKEKTNRSSSPTTNQRHSKPRQHALVY